jgi:hypothetical protein
MSNIDSSGGLPYRLALHDLTPWFWVAGAVTLADAFAIHWTPATSVPNLVAPAWMALCVAAGVRVQRHGGPVGHVWATAWRIALLACAVATGASVAAYEALGSVLTMNGPLALPPTVTTAALATIGFFGWVLIGIVFAIGLTIVFALISAGMWLQALVGYWLARLIAGPRPLALGPRERTATE